MNKASNSPLGREVSYPRRYDPELLFAIPRAQGRRQIGIGEGLSLPFTGYDRWQLFELSWLNAKGKPQVATATLRVPCDSPHLIESKSLKLYLNSLNAERFASAEAVRDQLVDDLSAKVGAKVELVFGLAPLAPKTQQAISLDDQDLTIDTYGPPEAAYLATVDDEIVEQRLHSQLLKSNCPVTGQPDWASVSIGYRGPRLDPAGLLRYLISFREHAEFHEQCVERIFLDISRGCAPQWLWVEARYTRRGGLDINPYRATPGAPEPDCFRDLRQ